ncbi:4-diphosphocytidyl-2-C-methyl-D-erythritol kinase [Rhodobium orientis]|uniref:4-diphosphocytidyl-2-C-methyl-D-erythritol kinase n=1 Tax=Rhodobium orientis TaxID=34017 RepID=A0A327JHY8_9HYPH|nr:4-(cytidine 5'-diphospho)-2-C-methyl-D-erythritol kinase [Rhodobium orientis]MBB4305488.1 4-diphosphocytidyl-2-C-methyl-D-erythritol kinase [Rhodobium orientis]MBK5949872.1 4-(cytidine 5'-diphospho)-2-C-methyl-D-erythritol kinase [Rhodobium orientis]RAI24127.1 4-(cytidine 5'-diphospho)-2-C-methyl-D-erythritol kinase [Rhodobium orientis]
MIAEAASAKINLALHVTGRRDDGYHLLDTLVAFADIGDRLTVETAAAGAGISLEITGPFAKGLSGADDNLVLAAARTLEAVAAKRGKLVPPARLSLEKNLPVASGIGGGSADAAATLRALNRLWGLDLSAEALAELSAPLGADVPMCVVGHPLRATGIGTDLHPFAAFAGADALLVNPGVSVSTPAVFKALTARDNAGIGAVPDLSDREALIAFVATCRNDLEATAAKLAPAIADALAAVDNTAPLLTRMSGSGATVFGLYDSAEAAKRAAEAIAAEHPEWWVMPTKLMPAV